MRNPTGDVRDDLGSEGPVYVQFIVDSLLGAIRDKDVKVAAVEQISMCASIVGERCFLASVDTELEELTLPPGARMVGQRVNQLLLGDTATDTISELSPDCVFGRLGEELIGRGYEAEDFPAPTSFVRGFLNQLEGKDCWGRVPLSIPADDCPKLRPLQAAFETRDFIDQLLPVCHGSRTVMLKLCTLALAEMLREVCENLDRKLAITVAFETVHGMAKTIPMSRAAAARLRN